MKMVLRIEHEIDKKWHETERQQSIENHSAIFRHEPSKLLRRLDLLGHGLLCILGRVRRWLNIILNLTSPGPYLLHGAADLGGRARQLIGELHCGVKREIGYADSQEQH